MQAIDLLFDQGAQTVGDGAGDLSNGSSQPPAVVLPLEDAKGDELVHHPHHEERIAVRPLVHGSRQLRRKRMPAETLCEIGGDVRLAQEREGEVLALSPYPQLLDERPQRMSRHDGVHGTIASDHEKARRLLAPPEHRHEIDRRVVAPVEILEHQQNGGDGGQGLEGSGHLAQHPLVGDHWDVAAQRLAIVTLFEPRQLRQPSRGVSLQDTDHPLGPGLAQQSPERLEDRQIRLRRPVVLEARTARNQQIRLVLGAAQERVEHRGLADTGFTGDEHQLAVAGEGARESALERASTCRADQRAARIDRRRDLGLTGTGADEPAAPARNGLDERLRRIVAERATISRRRPEDTR